MVTSNNQIYLMSVIKRTSHYFNDFKILNLLLRRIVMKIITILVVLISLIIGVNMVSQVKADQKSNNGGSIKTHAQQLEEAAAN